MSVSSSVDVTDVLRPVAPLVVHPDELPASDRVDVRTAAREGGAHVRGMARRRPVSFSLALLGSAVFMAGVLATGTVVGDLTDDLLVPVLDGGDPAGPRLRSALLALLVVGIWRVAGITLRRSYAGITQVGVLSDLRRALVRHQLDLSLGWYAGQRVGDLIAVNESHARRSVNLLGPLPFTTGALLLVLGTIVQAFRLDLALGALIATTMVLVVVGQLVASWLAMKLFVVEQHRRTVVARVAHESVDGAQTVRALGRRAGEVARVGRHVSDLRDAEVAVSRRFAWLRAAIETAPSVVAVPVLVVGALRVGAGVLTPGELVGLAYLLSLLSFPLAGLGFLLWDVTESLTAWRRVDAVLSADEVVSTGSDAAVGTGPGALRLAGVTFSYTGEGAPTLDVDLALPRGRTIAVVGPTGAGKSTLLELLAGLWPPTTGRAELDGRDLRSLTAAARTSQVALVRQEAFLFADTLRGNVAMGRDLTDEQVLVALAAAGAGDVVAELPAGLDTVLGERGVTLSGGQRQRVALARALAGRPRVLLLDDATSAVDPTVEQGVLDGLAGATGGATVVLVGSRPATIARCDTVVLLDAGRVTAAGPHDQLLREEPAYRRLLDAYEQDRRDRAEGVA